MLGFAPGPDIVFVLAQSAVYGARAGLATMCGLITGLCFHTTLVTVGVAALIQASPVAFTVLKAAGAAYLVYLAWLSWRAGAMRAGKTQNAFPGYAALYRRGILMNITNPRVSIFFLAFLPQFCDPARGNVGMQCLALGSSLCWPLPWPLRASPFSRGASSPASTQSRRGRSSCIRYAPSSSSASLCSCSLPGSSGSGHILRIRL